MPTIDILITTTSITDAHKLLALFPFDFMNEETGRRQFPFAIWNRTRHNWKERKAYSIVDIALMCFFIVFSCQILRLTISNLPMTILSSSELCAFLFN
ncbi:hypothetical protein T08_11991 [Trichinella sp. T8]|nr:hypothetical protein T08_11991 [Trichinella sp. T8]